MVVRYFIIFAFVFLRTQSSGVNKGTISKVLDGKHFRVSSYDVPPVIILGSDNKSVCGSYYMLLTEASKRYNFTLEWAVSPKELRRGPGGVDKNGDPTGSVGDVYYNRSDLALPIGYSFNRTKFIDFLTPLQNNDLIFITSVPMPELSWGSIYSSYNSGIWMLIFGTVLLVGITLQLLSIKYRPNMSDGYALFIKNLLIPFSLLLDQQITRIPKTFIRVVAPFLVFSFFIGAGYKTNLVSFLSGSAFAEIPQTYKELAERTDYGVALHFLGPGGIAHALFTTSENKAIMGIGLRMSLIPSSVECVLQAINPKVKSVCIGWSSPIALAIRSNMSLFAGSDPIFRSKDSANTLRTTIVVRKGSPYKPTLERIIYFAHAGGLVDKFNEDVYDMYRHRSVRWLQNGGNENVAKILREIRDGQEQSSAFFQLRNLLIVFILHGTLCLFSICLFCVERITDYICAVALVVAKLP